MEDILKEFERVEVSSSVYEALILRFSDRDSKYLERIGFGGDNNNRRVSESRTSNGSYRYVIRIGRESDVVANFQLDDETHLISKRIYANDKYISLEMSEEVVLTIAVFTDIYVELVFKERISNFFNYTGYLIANRGNRDAIISITESRTMVYRHGVAWFKAHEA